jgi:hypothetical protein
MHMVERVHKNFSVRAAQTNEWEGIITVAKFGFI